MILSIEEFEKLFKEENLNWDGDKRTKKQKSIELDGKQVYLRSHRYKLFLEQGYVCKCCGKVGTHFTLDISRTGNKDRAHLNLRADDGTLITKDHIIPKSAGGKDKMSNYQVYCQPCNKAKGNTRPDGLKPAGYYNDKGEYFPTLSMVFNKYENQSLAKNAKKSLILKRADLFLEALLLKEAWHGTIWEKISY